MRSATTTPDMFPAAAGNTTDVGTVYRLAARAFWPGHADLIYDAFEQINRLCFAGDVPMRGIVVGLTPHGGALGQTSLDGRITLHPSLIEPKSSNPWRIPAASCNAALLADVLVHEMIHAALIDRGDNPDHNGWPWCREIARLSPLVIAEPLVASPWRRTRAAMTEGGALSYQPEIEGSISRKSLAAWPQSVRPCDYYQTHDRPWWEYAPARTEHTP